MKLTVKRKGPVRLPIPVEEGTLPPTMPRDFTPDDVLGSTFEWKCKKCARVTKMYLTTRFDPPVSTGTFGLTNLHHGAVCTECEKSMLDRPN
jgi:hypothetical protein